MHYRFFTIPIYAEETIQTELNNFLSSVRILQVDRKFVAAGSNSFWELCIEYMSAAQPKEEKNKGDKNKTSRIDYREVLSPEDFAVFSSLRSWRKEAAAEAGVQLYQVFTNKQIAHIAENRIIEIRELLTIDGVGEVGVQHYGEAVCALVREALENAPANRDSK